MIITYIYKSGRKNKIATHSFQAKDFFYGYFSYDETINLNVIEFSDQTSLLRKPLILYDLFLKKILNIPSDTAKLTTFQNLKILLKSDKVILVNENVAFSSFFMLLLLKTFTKCEVYCFSMGLFSKKLRFTNLKMFHNFFLNLIILLLDKILFLGIGEYNHARKNFKKNHKFNYFPFSVDTEFWSENTKYRPEDRNYIIFVGNDGNRDYDLLYNISKKLKEFNFLYITNNQKTNEIKHKNVKVINGSWNNQVLTDSELKECYSRAIISLVPLLRSTQPSGQSVTLQSMSMGIPVIITKTEGFWDDVNFVNNKNIFFLNNNDSELWANKIRDLMNNYSILNEVSNKGKYTVINEYNLEKFKQNLYKNLSL